MQPEEAVDKAWPSLYLISPPQHSTNFFDIVFVHQLGGNARKSWEAGDGSNFFWPEHISTALLDTRVWSFGYPKREKIILRNIARALGNELGHVRRKDLEVLLRRPWNI